MLLRISREPAIFVFVIELDVRLFLFFFLFFLFFTFSLYSFVLFSSFAHFRLWFCNFLSLVSVLFNPLSFHFFLSPDVFSRIFRFDMSLPFYRDLFSFYFFLSFASSASFESAFPRALFISLALFHASFPFSSNLFFYFVSFLFFSPLPSLIPLFLSFSLLHRPRFTLIAHKEK